MIGRESSDGASEIAVVVASFRDPDLLRQCLDSVDRARGASGVPVIVARRGDGADIADVVGQRRDTTVVSAPASAGVPRLRGIGMTVAATTSAKWIAITEDHCLVDPGWLDALLTASPGEPDVIGGGMGNARSGLVAWGAYFAEYGFFSSTRPATETTPLITGANAAYAERVVPSVQRWARDGDWENLIHDRLQAEGARFAWVPGARVLQNATYRVGPFCRDRFEHGRDYARARLRSERTSRIILLMATPLLAPLLTWRVARAAARENPTAFVLSLPFAFLFLAAWAVGEGFGYLTGRRA